MNRWLDVLVALRGALDLLIRKELQSMPTLYTHMLHIVCPSAGGAMAALTLAYEVTLSRGVGSFGLSRRCAADANGAQSHWYGVDTFTADEMDVLRLRCSPGGDLYLLGVRMRRRFNPAIETTSGEEGKTPVTVYDVGDTIPGGVDWEAGRVSLDRLLADLSLVILEDDF